MYTLREEHDPMHIGLVKEVLQVVFGLDQDTLDRVIRILTNSTSASNIKTNMVRMRIGARAMKYLRNAIEISRSEGTEHHENDATQDTSKESDLEPATTHAPMSVKEANDYFNTFTLTETTMDIDVDDLTATKRDMATAKRNPSRFNREQIANARNDRQQAQRDGDPIGTKIASLRMQIKQLEMKKAQETERQNSRS